MGRPLGGPFTSPGSDLEIRKTMSVEVEALFRSALDLQLPLVFEDVKLDTTKRRMGFEIDCRCTVLAWPGLPCLRRLLADLSCPPAPLLVSPGLLPVRSLAASRCAAHRLWSTSPSSSMARLWRACLGCAPRLGGLARRCARFGQLHPFPQAYDDCLTLRYRLRQLRRRHVWQPHPQCRLRPHTAGVPIDS
jgi:hypothetical protein